ncbi:P-loop containing nucleoside triphosphate hydrolase protein [Colletotrichum navitas]|uniref:P-loop containing nucleoside triphosphate hydrolase protein n=1 Tax=Colletotrichum navitas TaxID=681940 RepID=A0AAD8PJJ1_9PEZI|nr:P-loop containing nucleoside triphosphate hydrolase protein [Colletotrichum navitas]KAK1564091.1 P-loop containing nucleoside triphosphate hydrolase protein [Colletotrichum navitas]
MSVQLHTLSTIPSALFLLLLPFRLSKLRTEKIKVIPGHRGLVKLVIAILLAVAQAIFLTFTSPAANRFDGALLPAILSFVASIGLCLLVCLEHGRSIKPSDLATLYLLFSSSCDAARLGAIIQHNGDSFHFWLSVVNVCLELLLLVIECQGKQDILRTPREQHSPEELAGILNRIFFWWINSILWKGYRNVLIGDNLPPIDSKLSSRALRQQAQQAWDLRDKPEQKMTLPKVLVQSMLLQFLAPIIPRLVLIAFRYAQPVLISIAIRFMNNVPDAIFGSARSVVFLSIVVYAGLAISRTVYAHSLNRLKTMIRGAVVGLIYTKALSQRGTGYDDGIAVALMSTDAVNVGQSAEMFHETWAHIIEVILGTVMLARQVGWVCLIPITLIFFCTRMTRYLAKNLQSMQKNWNVATQARLSTITSLITSMKGLKMLGFTPYAETLVNNLRREELDMAKKVRWMMVAHNASANALGIFSPAITLVLFVLLAKWNGLTLDTETAFTTTALLGLVTHPANMIMSIVPQAMGSLAAFERIKHYLAQPSLDDERGLLRRSSEVQSMDTPSICVRDVTIQAESSVDPIIRNANVLIQSGSIVMCSGPVASGKTAFIKALLSELPVVSGTISVSSKRIGYCEQSPWLRNGTLREAICGFMPFERNWYEEVVRLCCLNDDISALPNGDNTLIGSRGLNLSGGQRQRVALARAVYTRYDIMLLDNPFSALDKKTGSHVIENLLGPKGHFKKAGTTVFLTAHSATYFHLADWLVLLRDATITYQGTWEALKRTQEDISMFYVDNKLCQNYEEEPDRESKVQSQALKVSENISDLSRATGDISLYGYYLHAAGLRNFSILLTCTSLYSLFITLPQYWLQKWTAAPPTQTMFYIGGYLILSLLAWVFTNGSMWSTHILLAPTSGDTLHRRLLSTIIQAPLSYFFVTDTGAILNRFSQDIQLVDRQLAPAILSMANQVFKLSVQIGLLYSTQKFMTLTLPLCTVAVYLVQKAYLRTSRQLRLLDLESQSAVYSSFLEAVEGVVTIRAFGWQKEVQQANIESLDVSQQPSYILFCLQQWLSIVLDLIVGAVATGIIVLAVTLKGTTTAGQIGMALNIVLVANNTLFSLVTSWTNLEISLGAISRIRKLETETPKEDGLSENYIPDETWPSLGNIQINNVAVGYNSESLVLKDFTMNIVAGQQVLVCGRTGSGKSTFLLTLLRLLDTTCGVIKVDGVDLSLVPRSLVRKQCFITIAQDPCIIGQASLRFNLDPSGTLPDDTVVEALNKTSLWMHFVSGTAIPHLAQAQPVLGKPICSLPQMSSGQSQLFALARALLQLQHLKKEHSVCGRTSPGRIMPILLLDEATSSVDAETESKMHSIIRSEFTDNGHTVVMIAHKVVEVTESFREGQDVVVSL